MDLKYTPIFSSMGDYMDTLSFEDEGRMCRALRHYAKNGEYPNFEGRETMEIVFKVHAPVIDSAVEKMLAGKKGGRPRKDKEQS